ncbi:aromatic ring-hydroxylating dioxygenase subunit alpha [Phenylobacterium sp. LjRoot225]|uniref:aromatic ring-hydroxylating oxygenase subunit alpha n=1 Tax=Phenylobacterium sp. LjRoot225 TaxID=3342285 RepID=UPI003ECE7D2F
MNVQAPQFLTIKGEDPAGLGTAPVPAGPYYRDDWFELEREAIFKRTWLHIGHVCELPEPGSFIVRSLDFAKASILITRGKDGVIRAFHNVCTHRGTQLVAETDGRKASFTCRYHAWTFGNDGALRAAPDMERFYVEAKDCGLPKVAVDVCAGLIFVNLDPEPKQGLADFIGPLAEEMATRPVAKATTFSEYVYEIEANWKLTYDNFQENYHLRFIHPRSGAAAGGPDNPFGYPVEYGFHGQHRTQLIWSNPAPQVTPIQAYAMGKAMPLAYAEADVAPSRLDKQYFALFPNFFLFGSPGTHFSHTVFPISATRSRGVIRLYWVGDDDSASRRFSREYQMATALDIHAEDRAVIEAGQRGLNSGALRHIHLQSQEVLLRHLLHEVTKAVDAYRAELVGEGEAK